MKDNRIEKIKKEIQNHIKVLEERLKINPVDESVVWTINGLRQALFHIRCVEYGNDKN